MGIIIADNSLNSIKSISGSAPPCWHAIFGLLPDLLNKPHGWHLPLSKNRSTNVGGNKKYQSVCYTLRNDNSYWIVWNMHYRTPCLDRFIFTSMIYFPANTCRFHVYENCQPSKRSIFSSYLEVGNSYENLEVHTEISLGLKPRIHLDSLGCVVCVCVCVCVGGGECWRGGGGGIGGGIGGVGVGCSNGRNVSLAHINYICMDRLYISISRGVGGLAGWGWRGVGEIGGGWGVQTAEMLAWRIWITYAWTGYIFRSAVYFTDNLKYISF